MESLPIEVVLIIFRLLAPKLRLLSMTSKYFNTLLSSTEVLESIGIPMLKQYTGEISLLLLTEIIHVVELNNFYASEVIATYNGPIQLSEQNKDLLEEILVYNWESKCRDSYLMYYQLGDISLLFDRGWYVDSIYYYIDGYEFLRKCKVTNINRRMSIHDYCKRNSSIQKLPKRKSMHHSPVLIVIKRIN
jgi:hypothetical protein